MLPRNKEVSLQSDKAESVVSKKTKSVTIAHLIKEIRSHVDEKELPQYLVEQKNAIERYKQAINFSAILKENGWDEKRVSVKFTRKKYPFFENPQLNVRHLQIGDSQSQQILKVIELFPDESDPGTNSYVSFFDQKDNEKYFFHVGKDKKSVSEKFYVKVLKKIRDEVADNSDFSLEDTKLIRVNEEKYDTTLWKEYGRVKIKVKHTIDLEGKQGYLKSSSLYKHPNLQFFSPRRNFLEKNLASHEGYIIRDKVNFPGWLKYNHYMQDEGVELMFLIEMLQCLRAQCQRHLDEKDKHYLADALINALQEFHQRQLIHTDLKAENICLKLTNNPEMPYEANFIDINEAIDLMELEASSTSNSRRSGICGTLKYFAPEFFIAKEVSPGVFEKVLKSNYREFFSKESDIYALGLILVNGLKLDLLLYRDGVFSDMLSSEPQKRSLHFYSIDCRNSINVRKKREQSNVEFFASSSSSSSSSVLPSDPPRKYSKR